MQGRSTHPYTLSEELSTENSTTQLFLTWVYQMLA
jgi:hypothetical protein